MAIVTADTVKTALAITGTAKDDQITVLIAHAFEWIQDYCNDSFDTFDDGLNLPIIQMVKFMLQKASGTTSEKIGDYSVAFGTTAWPKSILQSLSPYRKAGFV